MARGSDLKALKNVLKSAIVEAIEENEAFVRRFLEEAIEDAVVSRAITEGQRTRKVSRRRVLKALSDS